MRHIPVALAGCFFRNLLRLIFPQHSDAIPPRRVRARYPQRHALFAPTADSNSIRLHHSVSQTCGEAEEMIQRIRLGTSVRQIRNRRIVRRAESIGSCRASRSRAGHGDAGNCSGVMGVPPVGYGVMWSERRNRRRPHFIRYPVPPGWADFHPLAMVPGFLVARRYSFRVCVGVFRPASFSWPGRADASHTDS